MKSRLGVLQVVELRGKREIAELSFLTQLEDTKKSTVHIVSLNNSYHPHYPL